MCCLPVHLITSTQQFMEAGGESSSVQLMSFSAPKVAGLSGHLVGCLCHLLSSAGGKFWLCLHVCSLGGGGVVLVFSVVWTVSHVQTAGRVDCPSAAECEVAVLGLGWGRVAAEGGVCAQVCVPVREAGLGQWRVRALVLTLNSCRGHVLRNPEGGGVAGDGKL